MQLEPLSALIEIDQAHLLRDVVVAAEFFRLEVLRRFEALKWDTFDYRRAASL
jgi:hypothetical protein